VGKGIPLLRRKELHRLSQSSRSILMNIRMPRTDECDIQLPGKNCPHNADIIQPCNMNHIRLKFLDLFFYPGHVTLKKGIVTQRVVNRNRKWRPFQRREGYAAVLFGFGLGSGMKAKKGILSLARKFYKLIACHCDAIDYKKRVREISNS